MLPPPGSIYAKRREQRGGSGGVSALGLLVRHPPLARAFLTFNRHLLYESELDERVRELVVLRVAWRMVAPYEWGQHVPVAIEAGLTREEVDRVRVGAEAAGWAPFDAALLRATDDLLDGGHLDDDTWATLAGELDDQGLLDLIFTVGGYASLAMAFNAVGLPLEPGMESFGDNR